MMDPSFNPRVYDIAKWCLGTYLRVLGLELVGMENIPKTGGAIVAANHVTNFDPFAVGQATTRRVFFMAKKELFASRLGKWFYTSGNAFPVDRAKADLSAMKTALRLLQAGQILVIFPQGTRHGQEIHEGIGFLATKAKVPIVPAGIQLLPGRFGKRYRIVYGKTIEPTGSISEITNKTMQKIEELKHN